MAKTRKIMTISDLYNFCVRNNFCHFSSIEQNEEICVQMPAVFEKSNTIDRNKEGLTPFVAKAYHDHINLNHSKITPEVMKDTLPSAMLRPILASIKVNEKTGEKDFGSHDIIIEQDENGNEKIRYIEQPVGVIFGDNSIEYDEKDGVNRAILHGYLYEEYCQDAVEIINRRKTVACSVELSIREMHYNVKDGVLTFDDFYVLGLTLLGEDVKPGMKNSCVTIDDFSKTNNSVFSANNNDKMIELLETLNSRLSDFNKYHFQKGGEAKMFEKLLEKYNKTVEDVTFEYSDLTDEELEAKFEEVFGEDDTVDTTDDVTNNIDNDNGDTSDDATSDDVDGSDDETTGEQFEKTIRAYELSHDDIRIGLYDLLEPYEQADNDLYWVVDVYDTYFVYESCVTNKLYGQAYTKTGDAIAFDGERYELFSEYLTASEKVELETMRSKYVEVTAKLEKYEMAENEAKKIDLLNSEGYTSIKDNEEFAALIEKHGDITFDELQEKCDKILLDIVKAGKFSYVENSGTAADVAKKITSVKMFCNPNNSKTAKPSRYGKLFTTKD